MSEARWRDDVHVKLRAEDQGSAILAMLLPNKENGSSTEAMNKSAVRGMIEVVRWAVGHYDLKSKRILQIDMF